MLGQVHVGKLSVALLFEWRDAWIGAYIKPDLDVVYDRSVSVYLCILPFFPIRLTWWVGPRGE